MFGHMSVGSTGFADDRESPQVTLEPRDRMGLERYFLVQQRRPLGG